MNDGVCQLQCFLQEVYVNVLPKETNCHQWFISWLHLVKMCIPKSGIKPESFHLTELAHQTRISPLRMWQLHKVTGSSPENEAFTVEHNLRLISWSCNTPKRVWLIQTRPFCEHTTFYHLRPVISINDRISNRHFAMRHVSLPWIWMTHWIIREWALVHHIGGQNYWICMTMCLESHSLEWIYNNYKI